MKYKLPEYFTFWMWINLIMIIIYSCLYMLYTDGQVTIKFIDDNYKFSKEVFGNSDLNLMNITVIPSINDNQDMFYSLRRYYNDQLDKNHTIQKLNFYLFTLIMPLFNIIYGLIIIFDGTIMSPKDLYTTIIYVFRGVKK